MLKNHSSMLNDESFRTLLAEVECIVNSRPLTVENLEDQSSLPLTPNTILTMKSKIILPPPGIFQQEDMYCRKRWRQVQHLANEFWTRWRKEYEDQNLPRNQWPLARVAEVFPSDDGLVRRVRLYIPTSKSELERLIHKLVHLVGTDEF